MARYKSEIGGKEVVTTIVSKQGDETVYSQTFTEPTSMKRVKMKFRVKASSFAGMGQGLFLEDCSVEEGLLVGIYTAWSWGKFGYDFPERFIGKTYDVYDPKLQETVVEVNKGPRFVGQKITLPAGRRMFCPTAVCPLQFVNDNIDLGESKRCKTVVRHASLNYNCRFHINTNIYGHFMMLEATRKIEAGEELWVSYGDDTYWKSVIAVGEGGGSEEDWREVYHFCDEM